MRVPDGIPTHDPLVSRSDALTIKLLRTRWRARVIFAGGLTNRITHSRSPSQATHKGLTASCSPLMVVFYISLLLLLSKIIIREKRESGFLY